MSRSRRAGAVSLVVLLLSMTLTLTMNVLPSMAASRSHPHPGGAPALPTSAHVFTPPSSATDWPMFHDNVAHTGVNASEALLTPYTVRGLGLTWGYNINPTCACHMVGSPTVAGGVVYVEAYSYSIFQGTLYAFNEMSGNLLWSYTTTSYLEAAPAVVGGGVFINNYNGVLYALNATTGKLLWSYSGVNAGVLASPTVVNGVVYVGGTAVNETTGKLLWSYADSTSGAFNSSPAVVNGMVYVVNGNGVLYALNATTGALLWTYNGGNIRVTTSPAVANGVVYMNLGTVYAVNATTGAKLWSYVGSGGYASPTVANGVVYVSQDKLNALDASTGAPLWSITDASGGPFRDVSAANGVIYASAGFPDNSVYAFDASTGAGLWSYTTTGDTSGFASSAVVANGMVFAVSAGNTTTGVLYAFQPAIRPLTVTQ